MTPFDFPNSRYNTLPFKMHKNDPDVCGLITTLIPLTATESVKELSISQRKCVFPEDINIDVSNIYSTGGCKMQCKYGKVMHKCNCYLPGFYDSGMSKENYYDFVLCTLNIFSIGLKIISYLYYGSRLSISLGVSKGLNNLALQL